MDNKIKLIYYFFVIFILTSFIDKGFGKEYKCVLYGEDGKEIPFETWKNGIILPEPLSDTASIKTKLISMKFDKLFFDTVNKQNGKYAYYVEVKENPMTDMLTLETGMDFVKYEEKETALNMTISIPVECNNKKYDVPLVIIQPILDTNNHDPEFLQKSYEYVLPMPLEKGFDITSYGQIVVKDIDLTNDNVTFKIDNFKNKDKFVVNFAGKDPNNTKHHLANFVTTDTFDLEEDVTFTLIATDSGNPPRSTNTTVTIKVDKANSKPRFSHVLYTANLTSYYTQKYRVPLNFSEGDITLTHGYAGDVDFEINGVDDEFKKLFKFTKFIDENNATRNIQLVLDSIPVYRKDFFAILKAIKNQTETYSVLYIQLPEFNNTPNKVSEVSEVTEKRMFPLHKVTGAAFSIIAIAVLCYLVYVITLKKKPISYDINNILHFGNVRTTKY